MSSLIKVLSKFKMTILIFALVFPIVISVTNIFYLNFDLHFILVIINIYYASLVLIYFKLKSIKKKLEPRSSIKFLRGFNITSSPLYWDKYGKELKHLTGVEIGVDEGKNAISILKNLNITKLYLVDPWIEYYEKSSNKLLRSQKVQDEKFKKVEKLFSDNSKVELIRKKSIEASKDFSDASLDFVYIDGDHSYESVKQDLNSWYPKLKKFGVMCGDDYAHITGRGVVEAVNEFAFEKKLIVITGKRGQFWFVKTKI